MRFFFEQIETLFIIVASPRPEYHIINHQNKNNNENRKNQP
ncbi:hypothetical protein HMPREF9296_1268 [Prevotella disiens FB035-09AN]|uniref:Uncharacterized protein n=1 Tax=Prevotella disiens FB035-09AN TaxID=866771 RepID=E1KMH8_9BACT|nr:hypothetical protein HMPREF9296_1268 [Prevotella disiens FB035-09AN]